MEQNKIKNLASIIIAIIAVGGISFLGGMKYEQGKAPNYQNLSQVDRQQIFQQGGAGGNSIRGARNGAGGNIPRNGAGANMNSVNGEVISKDDESITVKLNDGGSKIVFFSDKTNVSKIAIGTQADVAVGEQVMVSGTVNSDGSVNAAMIQIRPVLSPILSGSPASSNK